MTTLIHVTHEAREKMGGIGAVLEGLLTTRAYQAVVDRSILVGCGDIPAARQCEALEAVLYETGAADPMAADLEPAVAGTFKQVEATYGVRILYGRRIVPCPLETRRTSVELLLFDVRDALADPLNLLKSELWKAYGLESDRFEMDWGYEEWVRVAAPALECIDVLLGEARGNAVLVSHEFMGLPTLLTARLRSPHLKTVYWAHEVPPVRDLIEQETAHRLVFDQAMETRRGLRPYETWLRERGGHKHALVTRACQAHGVFAVSDRVARELHLLSPGFRRTPVEVVYNGLPARPIDLESRLASRRVLQRYAAALVGFEPDYVFTHVARPVASKAIERDLAVLEHLDDRLAERGHTAVLLVLATDGGRRESQLVRQMEADYGWPVHHRTDWPDLVKGEIPIGQAAETYNRWARATRAILINQFGFSRESCGDRMPRGTTFQDLRQGSDVEFGQSAYEPFGIAPLETLAFGGISVISRACGAASLLDRVAGDHLPPNVLIAHYCAPPSAAPGPISEDDSQRIEHETAARLAAELAERLPTGPDDFRRLLEAGWPLAEKMSWQAVCREYFVPALERCLGRTPGRKAPERATGGVASPGPASTL